MPTAEAFDAAARSFELAAESLEQLMASTPSHFGPDTLRGGLLSMVVDLTVSTATATALRAAAALADDAAVCRQRAATCRAFAIDMAAYQRDLDRYVSELGRLDPADPEAALLRRPSRPVRPFTWIET
jgi:hypothetical protein